MLSRKEGPKPYLQQIVAMDNSNASGQELIVELTVTEGVRYSSFVGEKVEIFQSTMASISALVGFSEIVSVSAKVPLSGCNNRLIVETRLQSFPVATKLNLNFPMGQFRGYYQWAVDIGDKQVFLGNTIITLSKPEQKAELEAVAENTVFVGRERQFYFITSRQSGKVLDISGGKTGNGTNIQLWEKHGGWNQIWEINEDGTILNPQSGKVLDISGGKTADGTNIHLWEKHGGGNQKWAVKENGTIINPQSGKVLDVNAAGTANGTNIQLWAKHSGANQQWILEPVAVPAAPRVAIPEASPVAVDMERQLYFITSRQSGKVLDISGGKTGNGTNIQLWEKHGGWNQIWEINEDGTISNPQSGKVLDISGGKTADGTNIHLWEKHGGGNQKWAVKENGTIVNPQSGKVLDVYAAGTANGTNIQLWAKHSGANQQWILEPVAPHIPEATAVVSKSLGP